MYFAILMRKFHMLLTATALCIFIFSCKKNKGNSNPLLLSYAVYNAPNDSLRYDYVYDESNRLTHIYIKPQSQSTATSYLITYSNNQIVMLYYNPFLPGMSHKDSIVLFIDSRNLLTKRIGSHYTQSVPGVTSKTYSYDTTTYQYNSQGLKISESFSGHDSTWENPLSPQTTVRQSTSSTTYTIANNNLTQRVENSSTTQVVRNSSSTTTTKLGFEMTETFEYSSAYPNKTDFTNSLVLTEVNPITQIPIAAQYKNFPNKMTTVTKTKDGNGNVTSTVTSQSTYQHTYNSDGFVATKTDSNAPGGYKYGYER
jgi:YD repeat-containing protein